MTTLPEPSSDALVGGNAAPKREETAAEFVARCSAKTQHSDKDPGAPRMPRRSTAASPLKLEQRPAGTAAATEVLTAQLNSVLALLDYSPGDMKKLRATARMLLEATAPEDGVEAMLASHLVASHLLAVDKLYEAGTVEPDQHIERRNVIHRWKQQADTTAQLAVALGRYRSRRHQSMRFEHVIIRGEPRTVGAAALPSSRLELDLEPQHVADGAVAVMSDP